MVILSYEFSLAFFIFFCIYWLCRRSIKVQNYLLITASILFVISWNWTFAISLLFMWQFTQVFALVIDIVETQKQKKIALIAGLMVLLAHLIFFKYSNFFIGEINETGLLNGLMFIKKK